jgi:hypothetical protein
VHQNSLEPISAAGADGTFCRVILSPKDLNGGKLNKLNQGHGPPAAALFLTIPQAEEGLKPGQGVKAAVNYLHLRSGNR